MTAIDELMRQDSDEFNKDVFLNAVNEALEKWRENKLYSKRLDRKDLPEKIESFEDLKKLPTVDMREFKEHPEKLAIDEEKQEHALYSSGTTSNSKSIARASEEGFQRHKEIVQKFSNFVLPEIDFTAMLMPSQETLNQLPEDKANRSVFKYASWIFEPYETKSFLQLSEEGFEPEVEEMVKELKSREGDLAIFSTPAALLKIMKKLKKQGSSIDMGENGTIITGGGWKGEAKAGKEEFRGLLKRVFGIENQEHLDLYGCTELYFGAANRYRDKNPDLKRISSKGYIWVADEDKFRKTGELKPVEEGEEGLMVGLDPCNTDYPGVILTDDIVRKTGGEYSEETRIEYVGRSSK
ncbi:MAG: hypothetical protein ABEJ93_02600 [Candidatus Nanohalobium sp.]